MRVLVGEEQPPVVPARPFGERQSFEHGLSHQLGRRPRRLRLFSIGVLSGNRRVIFVGFARRRAEVVELPAERLGEPGHEERGEQRRDPAERDGAADPAEVVGQLPRDEQAAGRTDDADSDEERVGGAAHLGREQLGGEGGEHDARAGTEDRRQRRRDPERRTTRQEEHHLGRGRGEQRDGREGTAAAALGQPARDDDAEDAGHDGRHREQTDDARAREVPHVLQVAVAQLRRRRVEDVGEQGDGREDAGSGGRRSGRAPLAADRG